jgi:hypothetical protein
MKVSDLIAVLSKFNPDLDITVAGVDFVVIHEGVGGYDGHVPPRLTRWIEINPPETIEPMTPQEVSDNQSIRNDEQIARYTRNFTRGDE